MHWKWCNCETVSNVARDTLSTCMQCGGIDAYKKSPNRPNKKAKTQMTRDEKKALIDIVIRRKQAVEGLVSDLEAHFGHIAESRVFDELYSVLEAAINATSVAIGDNFEWLDWYIYENSCGASEYEATANGITKKVCCIDDLLDLIESDGEGR